jgi:hypothetical protein
VPGTFIKAGGRGATLIFVTILVGREAGPNYQIFPNYEIEGGGGFLTGRHEIMKYRKGRQGEWRL